MLVWPIFERISINTIRSFWIWRGNVPRQAPNAERLIMVFGMFYRLLAAETGVPLGSRGPSDPVSQRYGKFSLGV
jgi:hypothetical protein